MSHSGALVAHMHASQVLTLAFFEKYPLEAARLLEAQAIEDVVQYMTELSPVRVAAVLQHTHPAIGAAILQALPAQIVTALLPEMSTASAVSMLRRTPHAWQVAVIGQLEARTSRALFQALTYPEHSAGHLADPHCPVLTDDRTVSDAIQWIRRYPAQETNDLFIINRLHHILGRVSIQSLLLADLESPLGKIMETNMDVLQAGWSLDYLVSRPQWELTSVLPVVNESGAFLGILRYSSIIKALRDRQSQRDHGDRSS
ncbi:MAG: magnesium transporter [Nitrospirae bacterium]|nr:MAG: magnesium transporter [Nitrospirota bacterium]